MSSIENFVSKISINAKFISYAPKYFEKIMNLDGIDKNFLK
jgi:hypothetical protein